MRTGAVIRVLLCASIAVYGFGCGGKKKGKKGDVTEASVAEGDEEKPAKKGSSDKGALTKVPSAAELAARGKGTSAEAAKQFVSWAPVHAFLGAPVVGGAVVSSREAIVFTKDNHVGVTSDGGASWGFYRFTTGGVRAVAGTPGGPFVVVGAGGFMSVSADGKGWTDLPRYTSQELVAVAVGKSIVAAGKGGAFVKVSATGGDAQVVDFPDKFKAAALAVEGDRIVAWAGKKGYESADGTTWTPTVAFPAGAGKESPTSRGLCSIGKVGKKKGVVCAVNGTAYGLGASETVVVGKAYVAVTRDSGSTWGIAPLPLKGIKGVAGGAGGPVHLYDSKGAIMSSNDGRSWAAGADPSVIVGAPVFPKPAKCEGRLPGQGEACQLTREITSPEGLPEVRAVRFVGDVGLAMGDSALVAMTADGGGTWTAQSGFGLGGLQGFDAKGDRVVIVGKTKVAVSTDGGKIFRPVDLPPKTPALYATKIAADGAVYLAGRGGTILKGEGDLSSWVKLDTGAKNKTDYFFIHEVDSNLYAAGGRGELHRSTDGGRTWTYLATGLTEIVQKMAGKGDTVFAITLVTRYGGNKLLRSNDGGVRFFVQRELSDQGTVYDFEFEDGVLRYGSLVSADNGATWAKATDWYWPGSVDIADGSGMRITNTSSYYGKDRFYVIGPEKDDFTVVDSFYNKGAWFRCDRTSGCWMVAGGQVYRPLR